jgi:hypothetical protein
VLVRRLLLLAAVLLLLTALAASIAPRQTVDPPATPLRTPATATGAQPTGDTVTRVINAAPGADSSVRVRRGDLLELQVEGDVLDTVLIERLDQMDSIEPTTPARFNLLVDAPAGTYPIRLVDSDQRIGRLRVTN